MPLLKNNEELKKVFFFRMFRVGISSRKSGERLTDLGSWASISLFHFFILSCLAKCSIKSHYHSQGNSPSSWHKWLVCPFVITYHLWHPPPNTLLSSNAHYSFLLHLLRVLFHPILKLTLFRWLLFFLSLLQQWPYLLWPTDVTIFSVH